MLNRELVSILKDNNEDGLFDAFIYACQNKELDLNKALQDWLNQVGSKSFGLRTIEQLFEDMMVLLEALDWIFENDQYKTYFKESVFKKDKVLLRESKREVKEYKRIFV